MLKDRQEILAVGELAIFLSAWLLSATVAVDYYRQRENLVPANRVAAGEVAPDNRNSFE
jgi:hypothetical protein